MCDFFPCFPLAQPAFSGADPGEGSEWPFPRPLRALAAGPGPALTSRLFPWHLLLSITAHLEN